jgi:hypothetical protein
VWLAPLVRLDLATAGSRALAMLPGAGEWELDGDGWRGMELVSRWNLPASGWDPVITLPPRGELKLSRRHHVQLGSDVVELLTACPVELDDHEFELTVNGASVPWHNNADRGQLRQWVMRYGRARAQQGDEQALAADRLAYWWDLQAWRGQEVALTLTLRGRRARSQIAWRSLALRAAIGKLPAGGELPRPDVPLLTVTPLEETPASGRFRAAVRGIPFAFSDSALAAATAWDATAASAFRYGRSMGRLWRWSAAAIRRRGPCGSGSTNRLSGRRPI